MVPLEDPAFKLGPCIGTGSFSQVFRATDQKTGQLVAVKKSRVPLRVKHTLFEHEARVLLFLHGHQAIPAIYAVGRFKYFEYLAMELLGQTLRDIQDQREEVRKRIAPRVAVQMLSALEHMHSHGLVHCDIKPDNILLYPHDPEQIHNHQQIRLIDFGLARPYDCEPMSATPDLDPDFVLGTLPFASLNAHQGLSLTRRDDLESLAYCLFSVLRGRLPWNKPHVHTSTPRSVRRHVYVKKIAWSGARLAEGYNEAFGQFLDEMRHLGFKEAPQYNRWQVVFSQIADRREESLPFDFVGAGNNTVARDSLSDHCKILSPQPPVCVVELGQLVYAQLLPRTTIEGYTFGRGDLSHWLDPTLSEKAWPTVLRPAVVLQLSQDRRGKFVVKLAPITRRHLGDSIAKVLLIKDDDSGETEAATVLGSGWPQDASWCYAFMHSFICNPNQTDIVPVHWRVTDSSLNTLLRLDVRLNLALTNGGVSKSDQQMYAKLRRSVDDVYIKFHPLGPDTLSQTAECDVVDWESDRGWFDELVPILQRRVADLEWWPDDQAGNSNEENLSNSYFATDFTEWRNVQGEWKQSIIPGLENYDCLHAQLPVISAIE